MIVTVENIAVLLLIKPEFDISSFAIGGKSVFEIQGDLGQIYFFKF